MNNYNTNMIHLYIVNGFLLHVTVIELRTMKLYSLKNIVFSIYSVGVILDHLTTKIGINFFHFKESNIFTCYLIENGLWIYVDVILFISFILIISFFNDLLTAKSNKMVLIFPLVAGSLRMMAGMWNIILLVNF